MSNDKTVYCFDWLSLIALCSGEAKPYDTLSLECRPSGWGLFQNGAGVSSRMHPPQHRAFFFFPLGAGLGTFFGSGFDFGVFFGTGFDLGTFGLAFGAGGTFSFVLGGIFKKSRL